MSNFVYIFFKMLRYFIILVSLISLLRIAATTWSDFGVNYGICLVKECCHEDHGTGYIKYGRGVDELLDSLKHKVYGQPLITSPIYKSIKAHINNERPLRPLVMYFSGWTGTGKTLVAKIIASSLYKYGMNSRFVKYISSSYHFPIKIEDHEIVDQRKRLRDMVRETVYLCPRSLIIFDELDKLPAGVVDALQPLVDYIEDLDGVRYNKAIFIFISNTGSEQLNQLSYKLYNEGKERKDLSSKDVEEILFSRSLHEQGGLRQSSLLRRYSIGVFVPFLPLERKHVELCIENEIENLNVSMADDSIRVLIEEIADELIYFPEETRLYSKSGCKGVHDKVINHLGPPVSFVEPDYKRSSTGIHRKFASVRTEL